MEQLEQCELSPAEPARLGGAHLRNVAAGVVQEERLLKLQGGGRKSVFPEAVDHPIPTDVAGEILLPWAGEKIVRLQMPVVGSNGAGGGVFEEIPLGLAVVDGEEQPAPGLGGDFSD